MHVSCARLPHQRLHRRGGWLHQQAGQPAAGCIRTRETAMKLKTMTAVLGATALLAAWGVTPPTTADAWAQDGANARGGDAEGGDATTGRGGDATGANGGYATAGRGGDAEGGAGGDASGANGGTGGTG